MPAHKKPTALKVLNGSADHDPQRINKSEPKLPPAELEPPSGITNEARKEWVRVMPILSNQMKVLTQADYGVLYAYCAAFGEVVWAQKELKKYGRQVPIYLTHKETGELILDEKGKKIIAGFMPNPAQKIMKDALASMRSYAASLGLSPADRSRVAMADSGSGDVNPMLKLLSGEG